MLIERFIVAIRPLKARSLFLQVIATIAIWLTLIPVTLLHVSLFLYQEIYFSIYGIPKVRFRDYFIIDRVRLKKLNWGQKMACAYCGYANALGGWSKAIANRTEVYSCAIKHGTEKLGQEHQKEFHEYNEFT
nr:Unknown Function [uncultured bacterium]